MSPGDHSRGPGAEEDPAMEVAIHEPFDLCRTLSHVPFRTDSQVASVNWQKLRKELSVGLELECFLPDLGALTPDCLTPIESREGLYKLVASRLTEHLQTLHGVAPKCRAVHQVSSDVRDWASLWTVTDDGSIKPELSCGSVNPFPVELVSKRMHFDDADVTLFCNMVHTLSSPPFCGRANESTGLHVHIGRYPEFFSFPDLACILKAYVRYEGVINSLLPVSRQKNPFCVDLREQLAHMGGLGPGATEERIIGHISAAQERVQRLAPEVRVALCTGIRGFAGKGALLLALLGEGLVWSAKRELLLSGGPGCAADVWVPAGMVLRELSHDGALLWREPGSADLVAAWGTAGGKDPPGPFDVLEPLPEDAQVSCSFSMPKEVPADRIDFWLFRNLLGLVGRKTDRFCKLNLMRIHMPSEKATIEFRQFPGGNFNRALTIWGWVKFLGHFISQSIAGLEELLPRAGPATEADLKHFMQLSNDTLLVAWYRDTLVQQPRLDAVLASMRARWADLWLQWRAAVRRAGEGPPTAEECISWRKLFWAAAGMKQLFPPGDGVWSELHSSQQEIERFMQRLYKALADRLAAYTEQLSAVEEVSRCTSLHTVVKVAVELASVQPAKQEIGLLQAAIQETAGWRSCGPEHFQRIADEGKRASELLLDHIRNLLSLCESSAGGLPGHQPAASPGAIQVANQQSETEVLVRKIYRELCGILAPRADEVQGIWRGLRERGWTPERVISLNASLSK